MRLGEPELAIELLDRVADIVLGQARQAEDDVGAAIQEFDRELGLAEPHRLYGREYTMHAHLGRGAALLRAGRVRDAAGSFLQARDQYPDLPLPQAGLALAAAGGADWTLAESAAAALAKSRPVRGALARGVIQAARGEAAAAAATLQKVLDEAPPGFAGWWLPVDPMLRQAIEGEQLRRVMATVAERAS